MNQEHKSWDGLIIAHRGCSYPGYNQNTIRAFGRVVSEGARALEFDVQLSRDGELFVVHDLNLTNVSNGTGLVAERPGSYIASLSAGDPSRGEDRIPTLREVFELVAGYAAQSRPMMNVELKGEGTAGPVCDLIAEYLQAGRLTPDDLLLSSFDWQEVAVARRRLPTIRRGLLLGAVTRDRLMEAVPQLEPIFPYFFDYPRERYLLPKPHPAAELERLLDRHIDERRQRTTLRSIIEENLAGACYGQAALDGARELDAWSLNLWQRNITARFVAECHRHGLRVYLFTVNGSADIARVLQLGVDGFFTDNHGEAQRIVSAPTPPSPPSK